MQSDEALPVGRSTIIRLTVVQSAVFLAIPSAYLVLSGAGLGFLGITSENWLPSILLGVAAFLAWIPVLYLPKRLGIRNELEEALALKLRVKDILLLNLLVSLSEEVFFRGFLLRIIGVIPQAIVFGVMHYIGYASLLEVAYALSIGLLLGFAYKLYLPNLLFPLTFHFLANAFSLLLTRKSASEGPTNGIETASGAQ
jgi:membrane protease YdiL (CAAX protease family)